MGTGATIETKIKTIDELSPLVSDLKKQGNVVVQCHGVFDLLHPGHIRHFVAAKHEGDILIVTVTPDRFVGKGPGRPAFNERLRAESIAALETVDFVALNDWPSAVEALKRIKPNIYCKGKDYLNAQDDITGKITEEEQAVRSVGGRIHFTDEITFSSTKLLNSHFDVFPEEARDFLTNLRSRYSSGQIIDMFRELRKLKVLIVGDAIIDEYIYCSPMGKSPKEILIPARYLNQETFAGGTLAIANHIAGFCDSVDIVTCLGLANTCEGFIRENLKPNVNPTFFYSPEVPTVLKRRFVEVDILKKLFEVCYLDETKPHDPDNKLAEHLDSILSGYDLVIVGDYGHGCVSDDIIKILCNKSPRLAVNAQTNSANVGFNLITKYPRADFICIDEPEIRLATHDKTSQLEELVIKIAGQLKCPLIVVTQGHRGSLTYDEKRGFTSVPVFSRDVIDRVGAGDAFLSVASLCMAAGFAPELIGFIGNAVGALKIRIVGNKSPVDPVTLFKYITTLLK